VRTAPRRAAEGAERKRRRQAAPALAAAVAADLDRLCAEHDANRCTVCLDAIPAGESALLAACLHAACRKCWTAAWDRPDNRFLMCSVCSARTAVEGSTSVPHPLADAKALASLSVAEHAATKRRRTSSPAAVAPELAQAVEHARDVERSLADRLLEARIVRAEIDGRRAGVENSIRASFDALRALLAEREAEVLHQAAQLADAEVADLLTREAALTSAYTVLQSTAAMAAPLLGGDDDAPAVPAEFQVALCERLRALIAAAPTVPVPSSSARIEVAPKLNDEHAIRHVCKLIVRKPPLSSLS